MRDRLTLKSAHQPNQAADPDDRPARAPGKQQLQALQAAFLNGIHQHRYPRLAGRDMGTPDPVREKARVDRITAGGLSCKRGHFGEWRQ